MEDAFRDATFVLGTGSDTLSLYGPGERIIYIYYGKDVTKSYYTAVTWSTANGHLLSVVPNGKCVLGDSCFALAAVTPKEGDGSTTITATLTNSEGRQRSLSLTVMIDGMRGDSRWSILPDGFITDTVGSTIFAMAYIKADTCINVGERWGIEHDTTYWNDRNYPQHKKDSLYEVWHHRYYEVWKWNADNVHVEDYFLGQMKVTNGLWQEIMGYNPNVISLYQRYGNRYNMNLISQCLSEQETSVYNVHPNYALVMEFLEKLRERTGLPYRLPTHAEWQFAAEGGRKGRGYGYVGSNDRTEVLWGMKRDFSYEAGLLKPNELGLYDMQGARGEWCGDVCFYQSNHRYRGENGEDKMVVDTMEYRPILGSYSYSSDVQKHWRYQVVSRRDSVTGGSVGRLNVGIPFDTTLTRCLTDKEGNEFIGQCFMSGGYGTLRLALSVADYKKAKGIK